MPIVIGDLGTITKGLLKDLEDLGFFGRVETIQMTACWERSESWDESWRPEETCCHSDSSEKPSANIETGHDWVGKRIHWEMCKKYKFDRTNKWYMHNIPTPALLRTVRILRRVLETWGDYCHSDSSEKPSANADVKSSNEWIIIIIIIIMIIIIMPGRLGSWRTGREYPNDSIAKNGQNPETSPGDLRRRAVTETPVKNYQLTLMWKL